VENGADASFETGGNFFVGSSAEQSLFRLGPCAVAWVAMGNAKPLPPNPDACGRAPKAFRNFAVLGGSQ
jgi:hypothetical protein